MLQISGLVIYPVKSMGGISIKSARVTDRGLEHDRRWMLIDDQGRFISQREAPKMALITPEITTEGLFITYQPAKSRLLIPLIPETTKLIDVTVWDDTCIGQLVGKQADGWFSNTLNISCRLVYMPDESYRTVDPKYAPKGRINSFSDAYPFLMIGEASLLDLSKRVGKQIPADRFRPNILFTGGQPYAEDGLSDFKINNIHFQGVKMCARCPIPNIDQQTAAAEKEPLKTLAQYRRKANKVWLGQNLIHTGEGIITVGNTIEVLDVKEAAVFD